MADLEEIITENEEDLRTFTENEKKLQEVYNSCLEKKYVYKEILSNQRRFTLARVYTQTHRSYQRNNLIFFKFATAGTISRNAP